MNDHDDDLLRDALRAEAGDVVAGEDLLARIRATTASERPASSRTRWLLAVAAMAALVIGAAAIVLRDDGTHSVDVVDDGERPGALDVDDVVPSNVSRCDGTTERVLVIVMAAGTPAEDIVTMDARLRQEAAVTQLSPLDLEYVGVLGVRADLLGQDPELAEAATDDQLPTYFLLRFDGDDVALRGAVADLPGVVSTISETCATGAEGEGATAGEAERPTLVALVREDGWLVTVDLATGEQRELYTAGDPRETFEESGPTFIDGVDLSPDGEWIYFSTCCEPASGTTFRIPVDGGEPERFGNGTYPRVSPDGRYVAAGVGEYLWILSTELGDEQLGAGLYAELMMDGGASEITWSPDGTQIAVVLGRPFDASGARNGVGDVILLDWDGTQLRQADIGKPSNPGSFASFTADGTLTISSGGPVDDDRWRSEDASRSWILWVDEDGVVREQPGYESGDRTPIEGLPEALAADW